MMNCLNCNKTAEHRICRECKDTPTWIEFNGIKMIVVGSAANGITCAEPIESTTACPTCGNESFRPSFKYHLITNDQTLKVTTRPESEGVSNVENN